MQVVTPEFAQKFECSAGACPDTCCQGWEIIIDPDALDYYRSLEGALGEKVRTAICPGDEPKLRFAENGRCVLQENGGLCKLQRTLGEQALCRVCRTYPRFVRQYSTLRETGVSLSCPEAVRLLLEDASPVRFVRSEAEYPIEPNDLEPAMFYALLQSRTTAFSLLQDRRYDLVSRLILLLSFSERVQSCLNRRAYASIGRVCRRFSAPVGRAAALQRAGRRRMHRAEHYRLLSEWSEFFSGLEILSPQWKRLLAQLDAFCADAQSNGYYRSAQCDFQRTFAAQDYVYEHILVSTLFKYWLEASDDGLLLPKVQYAFVNILLLRELNLMQWYQTGSFDMIENAHRIARELEHNEENAAAMRSAFLHAPCFQMKSIRKVILY